MACALLVAACSDSNEGPAPKWGFSKEPVEGDDARAALAKIHGTAGNAGIEGDEGIADYERRSRIAMYLAGGPLAGNTQARVAARAAYNDATIDYHLDRHVEREISDKAVKAYFENNKRQYTSARYHARHILLRAGPDESRDALSRHASELVEQSRGAADFSKLAKRHSDDAATASEGGDLGWINSENADQKLISALKNLEVGEVSDPIETDRGIQIFQLIEAPKVEAIAFEDVENQVRFDYEQKIRTEELERLAEKANGLQLTD